MAMANAVDKSLYKLEQMYLSTHQEQTRYTLASVKLFMSDCYFHSRTHAPPRRHRDRNDMAETLYYYINKTISLGAISREPKEHVVMNQKLAEVGLQQLSWE